MAAKRLPKLPALLSLKFSKTGQTRGADDDVIYQNRVNRSNTVLIPYENWEACAEPKDGTARYEKGFIVLLSPSEYFGNPKITEELAAKGLILGTNALVSFETREEWDANNPEPLGWSVATKRNAPLGGNYVARVPARTIRLKPKRLFPVFTRRNPKVLASVCLSMQARPRSRNAAFSLKRYSGCVWIPTRLWFQME